MNKYSSEICPKHRLRNCNMTLIASSPLRVNVQRRLHDGDGDIVPWILHHATHYVYV